MDSTTYNNELASDISRFYADPLGFVMYSYDWTNDPALHVVKLMPPWSLVYNSEYGPDVWFCELCDRIAGQVRDNKFNGRDAVKAIKEAVASGHGIGKSAGMAWIVDWIMSTRPHCHGTVTATTSDQLSSKTWAEIAKWTKRCITGHWFTVTTGKGNMKMYHNQHPESWYCHAQTCKEENSEAFAGQHAVDSTSFYLFDEASGVPDKIEEVSSGGLTDGEPIVVAFGNPTMNSGWFYECFHKQKHRWNTQQIDSRDVQITNKRYLGELIEDYGINSDYVKVRVRGMFPSMSVKQYISTEDADAAFRRHLRPEQYNFAPKILTLDNAWEGDDDLIIGLRQGLRFEVLWKQGKNDNDVEVANRLARFEDEYKADAVFIDGGFGTGVISAGKTMGRNWQIVWSSGESPDEGCLNMRAYMMKQVRDWLKSGGSYGDQGLHDEITAPQIVPRTDGVLQIEAKKDMKRRGVPSPNKLDALGLSFASLVLAKPQPGNPGMPDGARDDEVADYDPLASDRLR